MSNRNRYAKEIDGVLCRAADDAELANGSVAPIRRYYDADDPARKLQYVDFAVSLDCPLDTGDTLPVVTVDLRQGILSQIERQQPLFHIYKVADRKRLEVDILKDIQTMAGPCCPYFSRHGLVFLNGERCVYVCGDEVIGLSKDAEYRISPAIAAKHLAYDPALKPDDAVNRFDNLLQGKGIENSDAIAAVYLVLWLFTLITAFRSAIEDERMTTFFALLVIGNPGIRKTSAVRMLTTIFDLKPDSGAFPNEFNANSGFKAISAATANVPDQVVLVDDVTIAGIDAKESRQREEVAQQLVRFCVNSSEQAVLTSHTTAMTRKFRGGLVMTGECILSGASTNDRIINVSVKKPLVTTSAEGRTLAATVFRMFIEWALPRIPALIEDLNRHLAVHEDTNHLRLHQTGEILMWMLDTWYDFVAETADLPRKKKEKRTARAGKAIADLIAEQSELVDRIAQPQIEGNLLVYLKRLYSGRKFRVVNTWRDWHPQRSAVIAKGAFFATPEYLLEVVNSETPLRFSTDKALGKELDHLDLLVQRDQGKKTVKRHGRRVYYIALDQLMP